MMTDAGSRVLLVGAAPWALSALGRTGWPARTAPANGALWAIHHQLPDLVILGEEALDLLDPLREFSDVPVLVLLEDIGPAAAILRAGADDVLFGHLADDELCARVEALLRRTDPPPGYVAPPPPPIRELADLRVDVSRRQAYRDGAPVHLTRVEFDLLATLTAMPRRAFERRELIEQIWGPGWYGDEHLIDAHVSKLRRKLGDDPRQPRYIETVRGGGGLSPL